MSKTINLSWHWWVIIIATVTYLLVVALLFLPIWFILRSLKSAYLKEEKQELKDTAKLDAIIKTLGIRPEDVEDILKAISKKHNTDS
jgi:hypothetical protein